MDTVSRKKRSDTMRAIKSKDSVLEKKFRQTFTKAGYKYKRNVAKITGKPDIVFPKQRLAIFLDSCFWHGCKKHCRLPSSNRKYWLNKIENNRKRDARITRYLRRIGWRVIRLWEHQLKTNPSENIETIRRMLLKTL